MKLLLASSVASSSRRAWAEPSLSSLLTNLSKSPGFSATFVEEKRIALLETPVINRGRLYYMRPGSFARFVDAPFSSSLQLTARRVTLSDGGPPRVIDLARHPALEALAGSFLALFEGDSARLARAHDLHFTVEGERWLLVLEPKEAAVKRMVKELSFTGSAAQLATMTLLEQSGDRSHTRLEQVRAARTFTEDEKRRFFSPRTS